MEQIKDIFVELALPDGPISFDDEIDTWTCKLGGYPIWLNNDHVNTNCRICNSPMYLILQFENRRNDSNDRIIFVFCCNTRACSQDTKGWLVIIQDGDRAKKPTTWESLMGETVGKLESLKIESNERVCFPGQYLHFTEEIINEKAIPVRKLPDHVMQTSSEFDQEAYEKTVRPSGFDKTIDAFQKRIMHYPRQCVRLSEKPLFFCKETLPNFSCQECGSQLLHEFQLLPAILSLLPIESEEFLSHLKIRSNHPLVSNGMDWATVFVFTCPICPTSSSIHIQTEPEFVQFK